MSTHYEYTDDLRPGDILLVGKAGRFRVETAPTFETVRVPINETETVAQQVGRLEVVNLATGKTSVTRLPRAASWKLEGARVSA